jgi:IPT/TIG domain
MPITDNARRASRLRIFAWELFCLAGLWSLAGLYFWGNLSDVPKTLGPLPTGVLWFGALGAVLISLAAVFDFTGKAWDPRWELWHYTRPFIGATVAAISVLIFQAGIVSIGSDPTPATGKTTSIPKDLAYYLVAFLVGYREATFRELVKRLGDIVLKPGDTQATTITAVTPAKGPAAGSQPIALTGSGFARLISVRIGATEVEPTNVTDTHIVFTAPAAQPGVVPITVETTDGTVAAQYEYV